MNFDISEANKVKQQDANMGVHQEFQRHRTYLEKTVQSHQKKMIKDASMFKRDSERIMQENVALIKVNKKINKKNNNHIQFFKCIFCVELLYRKSMNYDEKWP